MRVGEIMTRSVRTVGPREPAHIAFEEMSRHGIHHLVVMEGKNVLGVVSERDLGGRRGGEVLRSGRRVEELMVREPAVANEATTVRQAANLLRGRSIGCLPVMEGGRLVGIVTVTDLLELMGSAVRKASTDARWKPVKRMGRWPRSAAPRHAH
jgi:acetoin utilization protein AcuB